MLDNPKIYIDLGYTLLPIINRSRISLEGKSVIKCHTIVNYGAISDTELGVAQQVYVVCLLFFHHL